LRLIVDLFHVLYCSGSMCVCVTVTHEINPQISRKLLKMDVLTFETCLAVNSEIIKQVTSSCSIFIQLFSCRLFVSANFYIKNAGDYPI
jgi:hypothetical protein